MFVRQVLPEIGGLPSRRRRRPPNLKEKMEKKRWLRYFKRRATYTQTLARSPITIGIRTNELRITRAPSGASSGSFDF